MDNGQVDKYSFLCRRFPPSPFSASFYSYNKDKWINYTFDGLLCALLHSLTGNVQFIYGKSEKKLFTISAAIRRIEQKSETKKNKNNKSLFPSIHHKIMI